MNLTVMIAFASIGLLALVLVGRAVSGARFNRALRAYGPVADRRPLQAEAHTSPTAIGITSLP
jgi:hypothetical protein